MTCKIGFIGGGQMAEALVRGILTSGLNPKDDILVCDPDPDRRSLLSSQYGVRVLADSLQLLQDCQQIILAVKPQLMKALLLDIANKIREDHLLITVAAGLPLSFYHQFIPLQKAKIIRVMPNTGALVLRGASVLAKNEHVDELQLQAAQKIFSAVGEAVILDETSLDAVTGLSGSGPAYVFSFIEALIDAGVKVGLSRDIATKLALQTVSGSVKLLEDSDEHPAVLRDKVCSPGGTTIAAMHVLLKAGFNGIVMDAVEASVRKSKELGTGQ